MDKKSAFVGVQFYSFVRKHSYVPTHFFFFFGTEAWCRTFKSNIPYINNFLLIIIITFRTLVKSA